VTEGKGIPERLGNVVYWLCTGVTVLVVVRAIANEINGPPGDRGFTILFLVSAFVVWLIGRAARYILTGR